MTGEVADTGELVESATYRLTDDYMEGFGATPHPELN